MAVNILWRFAEAYLQVPTKSKPQGMRLSQTLMRHCNGLPQLAIR
ncbi:MULTISPECIES: hypothetical protein [unclassified Ruegeria]|nr:MULTISPECIES: hypothetical protein [unclassified Ruegeria]